MHKIEQPIRLFISLRENVDEPHKRSWNWVPLQKEHQHAGFFSVEFFEKHNDIPIGKTVSLLFCAFGVESLEALGECMVNFNTLHEICMVKP